MNKYIPIPCEIYGNYELAILRRSPMRFCWRGRGDGIRMGSAVPINIRTRCQGEFLVMRKRNGVILVVRLDRILRTAVLRGHKRRAPSHA